MDKKYIVWTNHGYEGWSPEYYETLEEAINHDSYGSEKIITKKVNFTIQEQPDEKI